MGLYKNTLEEFAGLRLSELQGADVGSDWIRLADETHVPPPTRDYVDGYIEGKLRGFSAGRAPKKH